MRPVRSHAGPGLQPLPPSDTSVGASVMKRRSVFGGAALAAFAGGSGMAGASRVAHAASAPGNAIPDVAVTAHDGRRFRFYQDLVRDKVVAVNFFYVGCGGICP